MLDNIFAGRLKHPGDAGVSGTGGRFFGGCELHVSDEPSFAFNTALFSVVCLRDSSEISSVYPNLKRQQGISLLCKIPH